MARIDIPNCNFTIIEFQKDTESQVAMIMEWIDEKKYNELIDSFQGYCDKYSNRSLTETICDVLGGEMPGVEYSFIAPDYVIIL